MSNEKPQVFIDIDLAQLSARVEDYDMKGWRFVNICGSTVDSGVELIYSFSHGLAMENLRFVIDTTTEVPSVSDRFPNAFFYENETHDLYGIGFSGISIDFDGEFYTVSVPTPMNARSGEALQAAQTGTYGAADYGNCALPETAKSQVAETLQVAAESPGAEQPQSAEQSQSAETPQRAVQPQSAEQSQAMAESQAEEQGASDNG